MVEWKNADIKNLLKSDVFDDHHDDHDDQDNIAFVMFLEPPEHKELNMTMGEQLIDHLIQAFSEKPTMVHVELVLPPFSNPTSKRVHFATYLGSHADYQNQYDSINGVDFYLIRHGHRWRCLPVFGANAVDSLKRACDANVGSPYSLCMYPTSCQYFRKYSWIWSDRERHKGHCATLTARVLRQAGIECGIVNPSPWYSPSSLYRTIHVDLQNRLTGSQIDAFKSKSQEECEHSIETILRGPLSSRSLQELGHSKCVDAIRHLAYNVVKETQDGASNAARSHAERELGDAVFKFTLLRERR